MLRAEGASGCSCPWLPHEAVGDAVRPPVMDASLKAVWRISKMGFYDSVYQQALPSPSSGRRLSWPQVPPCPQTAGNAYVNGSMQC